MRKTVLFILSMAIGITSALQVVPFQVFANTGTEVFPESQEESKVNVNNALAEDISIDVSTPTKFKTYTDPVTGITPGLLTVSIPVSIGKAGMSDLKIELPYNFFPSQSNPIFQHFTMTDPIFSLVDPGTPENGSIVESYENDMVNRKLIIHLKDTKQTVETINVKFSYNSNYNSKIPANQIIWENLQTTVYGSDGAQITQSKAINVLADTRDGLNASVSYNNPEVGKYSGGEISSRIRYVNYNNNYSLLDTSYADNKMYVEILTGSTVTKQGINGYYDFDKGKTNADDSSIPLGYTRYYRELTDDKNTFVSWNSGGDVNKNYALYDLRFLPPQNMNEGEQFHVTVGMEYKKINGEVKTAKSTAEYIKVPQPDWELQGSGGDHTTGSASLSIVNTGDPSYVSLPNYAFSGIYYEHPWMLKNTGKKDITNTKFELYQDDNSVEKVNFDYITINGDTKNSSTPKSYYRTEFEITNSLFKNKRIEMGTKQQGKYNEPLPNLNPNEYISKISVIPMGSDGNTEGSWPSGNGFSMLYGSKAWPDAKWPNGTPIAQNNVSIVKLNATMFYDDESDGKLPTATTKNMNEGYVYYMPSDNVTQAYANFISSDANGKLVGDTVHYKIQGYNGANAIGNWKNPIISVAIPKQLEMVNPNELKDFVDVKNKKTYTDKVTVTKLNEDDQYNYYRFEIAGIGEKNNTNVSFEVPLEFVVAKGTVAKKYSIPPVVSSSDNFIQIKSDMNNLSDAQATAFGYDNSTDNYTATKKGSTPLDVVQSSKLEGLVKARGNAADQWTFTDLFAVNKASNPQINTIISNEGNTHFGNLKLYSVLPYAGDALGSTGNFEFKGLLTPPKGTTVYYTTKNAADLPAYDTNLKTWDTKVLKDHGFSTTFPADMKSVTAVFVDFKTVTIGPNEKLEAILEYYIPEDASNQKAISQFQYYAEEAESGISFNASSEKILFSTEISSIGYSENLPNYLLHGVTNATNMPTSQTVLLDVLSTGTITLSDHVPSLPGYTFIKWVDHADPTKEYNPGDVIQFDKVTTIELEAVWEAIEVNVDFNKNDGTNSLAAKKKYAFGEIIDLNLIDPGNRVGYTFKGWTSKSTGKIPDFIDKSNMNFLFDKVVYAIWDINKYNVTFDSRGGDAVTNATVEFNSKIIEPLPPTRKDHVFGGWYKEAKCITAWDFENEKMPANNVTLYAKWILDAAEINRVPIIQAEDKALKVGDAYDPLAGVSASDAEDGDIILTNANIIANNVDMNQAGTYSVTYEVSDSKGATATKTIQVVVNMKMEGLNQIPIIHAEDKVLEVGDVYDPLAGVSANDAEDGEIILTNDNIIANNVDMSQAGTYSVTYEVSNSKGKSVVKTITVKVISSRFSISIEENVNKGFLNTDKKDAPHTDVVTIMSRVDDGYRLKPGSLKVVTKGGKEIIVSELNTNARTEVKEHNYNFVMPNEDVIVTGVYDSVIEENTPITNKEQEKTDGITDAPKTGISNSGMINNSLLVLSSGFLLFTIGKKKRN